MNLEDLSTQLLFTAVPIWIENEKGLVTTATGCFYSIPSRVDSTRSLPFLVTASHVFENWKSFTIELIEQENGAPSTTNRFRVRVDADTKVLHVDQDFGLAAIPVAPIMEQAKAGNKDIFYRSLSPNIIPSQETANALAAVEEVIYIGFPTGFPHPEHLRPLVTRCSTATPIWSDFAGEGLFLLGSPIFPGADGGPVFVLNEGSYRQGEDVVLGNRLFFVGVMSGLVWFGEQPGKGMTTMMGRVIKSDRIRQFIDSVVDKKMMGSQATTQTIPPQPTPR